MVIEGKEFKLARITLSKEDTLRSLVTVKPSKRFRGLRDRLHWRKFCRTAFEMGFVWRYLHIPPKELWYRNITVSDATEVQASFFALYKAEQNRQNALLLSLKDSAPSNQT